MKSYRIACIPGDGIGKEVVPAGQAVLEALAAANGSFEFDFENFGWGGDWYRAHGEMMPHDGLDALRNKDAILFGSAGDPHIPDHITLWGLRLAQSRPRKLLTVVTKSNAQRHAMVMWDEIAVQVSKEFPDVSWDKELVDAATARMVNRPATLDTLVATNLHADILSDLAAALAGSLGIAPTGNIDPERRYPSMFEPIHGSAFDIMGKGLANPVGTFWSCVMLLEHIGELEAARTLMGVIEQVTANPALHTGDLGGKATTAQVTQAVCGLIAETADLVAA
ncbi:MAG: isocitrate/isopropylmalate family dehydrogenase [Pseudomonadota bacterium]